MKRTGMAIAISTLLFAACQKEQKSPQSADEIQGKAANAGPHAVAGHVYTISNEPGGNRVLDYARASNGMLSLDDTYPTGGTGTGAGLGSQGAVIFGDDGNVLLVVNPGSNTISSFKINPAGLVLKSVVNSGGMKPVSLTCHNDIVYVLNQGGNGNISGFKLRVNDKLEPIPNSTRPLSVNAPTDPAQVSFTMDGSALIITEKATNTITTYTVDNRGMPGARHSIASSTPTPFGFDIGANGLAFISEAAGGAPGASALSSYRVMPDGSIALVEGSVSAGQTAACWVIIKDNRYAYLTNTGSNTISNFDVNFFNGDIAINDAVAATTPPMPIDAALSHDQKFLYVLNAGGHSISVFSAAANGDLNNIQTVGGLPPAASGLAAK